MKISNFASIKIKCEIIIQINDLAKEGEENVWIGMNEVSK
jgi:hypothetical protein